MVDIGGVAAGASHGGRPWLHPLIGSTSLAVHSRKAKPIARTPNADAQLVGALEQLVLKRTPPA